jgi:voltage-gated potassium channel
MQRRLTKEQEALEQERRSVLEELEDWLEPALIFLGFVWLVLLVVEFTWGLTPLLELAGNAVWIVFIVDFVLKLAVAPRKLVFLKANVLTLASLLLPALRVLRIFRTLRVVRAARVARGARLLRVVSSLNRGMRALHATMRRRGFGYAMALTVLVTFGGAAGMLAFERGVPGASPGLPDFGTALWWTAMLMTTMGSDYWPQTAEGRLLCLLLAMYGFAVFGYVTATLATFFIGRDAQEGQVDIVAHEALNALSAQIEAMHADVERLRARLSGNP